MVRNDGGHLIVNKSFEEDHVFLYEIDSKVLDGLIINADWGSEDFGDGIDVLETQLVDLFGYKRRQEYKERCGESLKICTKTYKAVF